MIHLSGNLDVGTEGAGRECSEDFSKAARHLSVSPEAISLLYPHTKLFLPRARLYQRAPHIVMFKYITRWPGVCVN